MAILAFRNEAAYLANALRHLASNGVRFALIDNGSEDGSRDIALRPEFAPFLVDITDLPFNGAFDLSLQLEAKAAIIDKLDADWVIHCDADEVMHSYRPDESLRDAIIRSDRQGFNVIDFDEFVFLPLSRSYVPDLEGEQPILSYYFHRPHEPRLMRAWKKSAGFDLTRGGGHHLEGDGQKLDPEKMVLRHYIFRDQAHALAKYAARPFSDRDVERGWHGNRMNQATARFQFPDGRRLHWLANASDRNLRRDFPRAAHYWKWASPGRAARDQGAGTDTVTPVSVVMATPPGFNPGMLVSEVTARAFCERQGFASAASYFRFTGLAGRLGAMDERHRAMTMERCDLGIEFNPLQRPQDLEGSRILYWGDFLHMRQYVLAISQILAQYGEAGRAEEMLLLAGVAPKLVERAVSFGTTLLFNTATDLLHPSYGPHLKRLVERMKFILVRDMVSAAQLASLSSRQQGSFLGLDAAQLLTLHDDWRDAFGPGAQFGAAERDIGLAFFARAKQNSSVLAAMVKQLERTLPTEFRWMRWGDDVAFPALAERARALRLKPMNGPAHPRLEDLMNAIASAKVVVTDTYHVAVTAWSLGTPAIMIEGDSPVGERDVNSGVWYARIDKRAIFFAQHGLGEFYLDRSLTGDRDVLQRALDHLADLIREDMVSKWHVASVRAQATRAVTAVANALQEVA